MKFVIEFSLFRINYISECQLNCCLFLDTFDHSILHCSNTPGKIYIYKFANTFLVKILIFFVFD